ncbi:MAG: hypothetical protein EOO73_24775 [Myxococcales bacterium]|nr:MAG: hypothetical protein EOO73_24775 [Myxococcales bacterium]
MRAHALASLLVLLAAGCGGSSSETPPPLEPDPTSARYTGPRFPSKDEPVGSAAAPEAQDEEEPALPARPGRSTWGSGRAAPSTPAAAPRPSASASAPVN